MGKRVFDLVVSVIGLLLSFPFLLVIALAVKLNSPGPVLFRQTRVGKLGREFEIFKFRSMTVDAEKHGAAITSARDPRVTSVGALLRRTKVDEIPQLWNVVRGEMSLVGPRPEHPKYVAFYTPEQRAVLSVAPGITSPTSLKFRHEEELLSRQPDPERFYVEQLMPEKLSIDLKYVENLSMRNDLSLIFSSVVAMFKTQPETK
ncbi:MAG TPA: sugar transferase [Candidatus Sulfotelmatobacter sp.]|nr:sugar transferase [Candidatus Sulfotelmatobacter sp.]